MQMLSFVLQTQPDTPVLIQLLTSKTTMENKCGNNPRSAHVIGSKSGIALI